jgi:hypothetical protein
MLIIYIRPYQKFSLYSFGVQHTAGNAKSLLLALSRRRLMVRSRRMSGPSFDTLYVTL